MNRQDQLKRYFNERLKSIDEARQSESRMLLGEVNKLRDVVCPDHKYEYKQTTACNINKFVCSKCGHYIDIHTNKLTDGLAKIIASDNFEAFDYWIKPTYLMRKEIEGMFKS